MASPGVSILAGALFFVAYLLLAPPVTGDKDAGEFTLVLATAGVAHPTGYPLFTLLGHAFVEIAHALGASWPFAANAWSALGGGVAMGCFHALAVRLGVLAEASAPIEWVAAPALLFGLDPIWTQETTLAEVYSWHVAWALGACLIFTSILRVAPDPETSRARRLTMRAAVWGAWCGVGLAHHVTSVLVAAPLSAAIVIALARARAWRWRFVAAATGAALVPLASYGFIAWRAFHPAAFQWPVLAPTWTSVVAHVTGAQYRSLLGQFAPSPVQRGFLMRYVYPELALGLAALVALAWRAPTARARIVAGAFLAAALLSTAYPFAYGVSDPSSYFLAGLALGMCAIAAAAGVLLRRGRAMRPAVAVALALMVTAALVPWMRTSLRRREVYVRFETLVHRMWASIPFPRGIVAWSDDMYVRLRAYQLLDHEKPGLAVVNPVLLTHARPREGFIARVGFDPLAGIADRIAPLAGSQGNFGAMGDSAEREARDRILENINRQTGLPVVVFVPESTSVRLLRKPGAAAPHP